MTVKIKVKDKLEDDTLDLSFCDLQDVPIREIATIKKASRLDLSNNQLTSIPKTIVTLTNIVKLDLSKNMLTEIPENIGEMRQLRNLDLYSNQISRLPLSMGELKNLKWLDLKDNPLTSAVASVAGMCSNANECQACARNIVAYLSSVKQHIEEEKMRRINSVNTVDSSNDGTAKKEMKKKKKKKQNDNEEVNIKEISPKLSSHYAYPLHTENICTNDDEKYSTSAKSLGEKLCNIFSTLLYSTVLILLIIGFMMPLFIVMLPKFDETLSDNIVNYLEIQTKLPVKYYQQLGIEKMDLIINSTIIIFNQFKSLIMQHYENIANNF